MYTHTYVYEYVYIYIHDIYLEHIERSEYRVKYAVYFNFENLENLAIAVAAFLSIVARQIASVQLVFAETSRIYRNLGSLKVNLIYELLSSRMPRISIVRLSCRKSCQNRGSARQEHRVKCRTFVRLCFFGDRIAIPYTSKIRKKRRST